MLFDVLLVASPLVGSSVLCGEPRLPARLPEPAASQRIRDIGWPVVVTLPAYAVAYFCLLILSETRAPPLSLAAPSSSAPSP